MYQNCNIGGGVELDRVIKGKLTDEVNKIVTLSCK